VLTERSSRRRWASVASAIAFGVAVALPSLAVIAWQRERAGRQTAAEAARRFAGAESIIGRGARMAPATLGAVVRVDILRDSASARYYDTPATMDSIVDAWRVALETIGADAYVRSPSQVLASRNEQVLIVPASPCLGRDARHAVADATRRGVGVIMTWLSGVRDGGCRGVGYGLITELSGATRLDTLRTTRRDCYITFLRGGPLAADIPPGARMEIAVGNHVALRTPQREAYYSDYMLNPRPVGDEPLVDGAIVQTSAGAARAVYWGFDLRQVANEPWDRELALRLTRNSVAWVAHLPLATVEAWPYGKSAVAVFAQDVEDEFANARFAVDSLRAAKLPGTFYLVSRLAERNMSLSKAMAAQGEIGSHTPRHQLLGGTSLSAQQKALEETQHELADVVGHPVAGLRPPEEQFDGATLSAWHRAGGRYVFATLNGRSASPEILPTADGDLVVLGRVNNDDFIEVGKRGLTNVDSLAHDFLTAFDKVRALGGLYVLSYHSQMLSRPELVPALARVARHIAADGSVWVTTAGAVADWWHQRSLLAVRARFVAPTHLVLDVSNADTLPARGAVARIAVGREVVEGVDGGGQLLASDGDAVRVLLPTIEARSRAHVTITFARSLANPGYRDAR